MMQGAFLNEGVLGPLCLPECMDQPRLHELTKVAPVLGMRR